MPKWFEATLIKRIPETDRVYRLVFQFNPNSSITWQPGQFITIDLPIGDQRIDRWKSYSIANLPNEDYIIELCVGQMEHGKGSNYLCQTLQIGETIQFKYPQGVFVLPAKLPPQVVMICTGTGIVPFIAMLTKTLGHQDFNNTHFHLIFGTKTTRDLLFKAEINRFINHSNFFFDVALSREQNKMYHSGYIHDVYIQKYKDALPSPLYLLCGWQAMIDQATEILTNNLEVDRKNIITELYG